MSISTLLIKGSKLAQLHSPEILTALSISGVVATSYLTVKSTLKAKKKLDDDRESLGREHTTKEKVKIIAPEVIPPAITGVATIATIFGSHKASARRTAAAVAAYSLTNQAFDEYRQQVSEQLGSRADKKIEEAVVDKKIKENPPSDTNQIVVMTGGDVLCCDLMTMRYFRSDMETLKSAQNKINERMLKERWMSVREFYNEIGVYPHSHMDRLGWDLDVGLMELVFTTSLTESNEPCLAFTFNYTKPL